MIFAVREEALSLDEVVRAVSHSGAGAVATFVGVVRDHNEGHAVTLLEYQAYVPMAVKEMKLIAEEIALASPGVRIAAIHRTGKLVVGDAAIVCAASAPHRGEAFAACRKLIDEIKSRVPIWKREFGPDGAAWIGWTDARCVVHDHH